MREIKLVNCNLVALVDDEDYDKIAHFSWQLFKNHGRSKSGGFYAKTNLGTETIYMHQLIMPIEDVNITIDHRDGNGLNNQKHNFRPANKIQQGQHSKKRTAGSSVYKGVSYKTSSGKWVARIMLDGKCKHLGYFEVEIEAAKAYNFAAKTYFKEFASINFG